MGHFLKVLVLLNRGLKNYQKSHAKIGAKSGPKKSAPGRQGRPPPAGLAEGLARGGVIFTGSAISTNGPNELLPQR